MRQLIRKTRRVLSLTLGLAATILLIAACRPVQPLPHSTDAQLSTRADDVTGGTLTIALAAEPGTLDPARGRDMAERFIFTSLFDTLVTMAPDGSLHPGLATTWASNAEATAFTFTLRDGVTFHDGTPLDAGAVAAAFDRVPQTGPFSMAQYILRGYGGAEVVDENTIRLTFDVPKPRLLADLSLPWMGIPSPAVTADNLAQRPVGTGPFMLEAWVPQDHIALVRNPAYAWAPEFAANQGSAYLDEVVLRFLPDSASRLDALQTGAVQVIENPPAQEAAALVDAGNFDVMTYTTPGLPSHMMLNVEKAPTDELAVRLAMNHAVDQAALAASALAGLQSPAYNVLSPVTADYDAGAAGLYGFDRERAELLLEQAGWIDTNADGIRDRDGQELTLIYPAVPAHEAPFMQNLANYLTDVGFTVTLLPMDEEGAIAYANAGSHNMVNMRWVSIDPGVLDLVYNSANIDTGAAFSRFRSAELDEILTQAGRELDPELRASLYAQAQLIIMENALALPIHNFAQVLLMTPEVDGWRFDAEGYPYLNEVSFTR